MGKQMLRSVLEKLKENNKLKTCKKEVDPKFELGAVLKHFKNTKPILFDKVKRSKVPVIGGMFGDRKIWYEMLQTSKDERIFKLMDAIANPKPTKLLNAGPILENVILNNINISSLFPIPTYHEKDSASFITAGIVLIKDPETGKRYTSVRRLQVNSGNNLSLLIASPLLTKQIETLESKNKQLEIAVIIGYDFEFLLASQISSSLYGVDKYGVDSALRGEALELVKCRTVDLEVPAYAEIVLEGVLRPKNRKDEGPFGELMGYYGGVGNHPTVDITAVLHRNNPIYQTSFPCREEHLSNALAREVELYRSLDKIVDVNDVHITIGGGCRFHAIVSINKKSEGDSKAAIISALSSDKDLKHVVIVDEDIDIFDSDDVEGAIATRVQGVKDIVVIPNALGSGLDPSHNLLGTTDKVGIDATKPLGKKRVDFDKAVIPKYEDIDINKYF
ncbi:MAG: ubiquinone biosynthesis protein UbiD [Alkaliphilus sp.]|nr:UbiD family decarboxylase [bacterium AH-315-L21]MBN4069339.1 UbiD family decarboxylase [bacterium AH-315-G05]PHS35916.1 MAG: ubiquinone biosynthesis protein UbiD [Alkaliphilus sp.]